MKHASASHGFGGRSAAHSLVRVLWLVVAFALPNLAHALTGVAAGVSYAPSAGSVTLYEGGVAVGNIGRDFAVGAGTDTVAIAERLGISVGGEALTVNAVRTVAMADVALAAAALGGAAWAGVQIGAPISKALGNDTVTVGSTRCTATNTGWKCDSGSDPLSRTMYCTHAYYPSTNFVCGANASLAAGAYISNMNQRLPAEYGYGTGTSTLIGCNGNATCTVWMKLHVVPQDGNPPFDSPSQVFDISFDPQTQTYCDPSVDFANPAWSVTSETAPDPDGKCKTGRYSDAPATRVADRIMQYGDKSQLPQVARDAIAKGATIPNATTTALSGPSTITQPQPTVETTTNPDGSTTTKTTQKTVNYTYSPSTNQVAYTTTNVVTTTNNTTNTSTTTTTTTQGQTPDAQDPCNENPDRAGCAKMGEPPQGEPLSKETKNIELKPVDFASGGCPGAVGFTVFGSSHQFEFTPLCDAASTWVRGVVLVIAAAVAGFVFIGGLKT